MDFSSAPKALNCLVERLSMTTSCTNTDKEMVLNTLEELKLLLPENMNITNESHDRIERHIEVLLEFGEKTSHWESIAVSFYLLDTVLNLQTIDEEGSSLPSFSENFRDRIVSLLNKHRENKEHRIRNFVVKLSGSLCKAYGLSILSFNYPDEILAEEQNEEINNREWSTRLEVLQLVHVIEKQLEREEHSFTPAPLYTSIQSKVHFDGISGWNSLESNVLLLASIIEGAGSKIFENESLNKLLFSKNFEKIVIESTKKHLNRHIREATYTILAALIRSIKRVLTSSKQQQKASNFASSKTNNSSLKTLSAIFREVNENITLESILATLELGLKDTWPQVIYAASTTTKLLLETFPVNIEALIGDKEEHIYVESLLPYLCMNRYYIPEGVQILSQRIWEESFRSQGKLILTSYLNTSYGASHATQVYHQALQALNPFNRVSALYTINEIINKIDPKMIQVDFSQFSENLIYSLNDEHWEVRIAACQTFSSLFLLHPKFFNLNTEAANISNEIKTIKDLIVLNLFDNCWSLREAAANALANALQAELSMKTDRNESQTIDEETKTSSFSTKEWIFDLIFANIDKANSEQGFQNTKAYQQEKQDFYKHSGHYLLNCCGGGNHSTEEHHYQLDIAERVKLQQPWFKTDGTIYLVTALTKPATFNLLLTSSISTSTSAPLETIKTSVSPSLDPSNFVNKELSTWLSSISDLCFSAHFGDMYKLKCTIYDNLGVMASNLGKKYIKKYVDNFIPSLFQAVVDPLSPKLLSHSASQCIYKLYITIGATIFVARLPPSGSYHKELNNILLQNRETIENSSVADSICNFSIAPMDHNGSNIQQFENISQLKL